MSRPVEPPWSEPRSGADSPFANESGNDRDATTRWSWNFGIVELFGLLLCMAILFASFASMFDDGGMDEGRRRFGLMLIACTISLGGTYLSSRLATKYRIRGNMGRLALQLVCTFCLIPPLWCLAIATLPAIATYVGKNRERWD